MSENFYAGSIVLIFTDVKMPVGRDGLELAKTTSGRWADISIVVASSCNNQNLNDLPEGAVFIDKPFSDQIVHDHIDKTLPQRWKPEPPDQRRRRGR